MNILAALVVVVVIVVLTRIGVIDARQFGIGNYRYVSSLFDDDLPSVVGPFKGRPDMGRLYVRVEYRFHWIAPEGASVMKPIR